LRSYMPRRDGLALVRAGEPGRHPRARRGRGCSRRSAGSSASPNRGGLARLRLEIAPRLVHSVRGQANPRRRGRMTFVVRPELARRHARARSEPNCSVREAISTPAPSLRSVAGGSAGPMASGDERRAKDRPLVSVRPPTATKPVWRWPNSERNAWVMKEWIGPGTSR
jgi:hypothetical protein